MPRRYTDTSAKAQAEHHKVEMGALVKVAAKIAKDVVWGAKRVGCWVS